VTIEERFERFEHFSAGSAEERRRDRDESRQLWRETQRQLGELAVRVNDLAIKIVDVDERLGNRIDQMAEENRKYAVECTRWNGGRPTMPCANALRLWCRASVSSSIPGKKSGDRQNRGVRVLRPGF
jgi:hypothetical protein